MYVQVVVIFIPFIFRVVSQSFMCYGVFEAQQRYDHLLVYGNTTLKENEVYIDPCLAKGVVHNLTDDANTPCTLTDGSKPTVMRLNQVKWHKLKMMFERYEATETEHEDSMKAFDRLVTEKIVDNDINTIYTNGSSDPSMCDDYIKQLFDVELCEDTFTYGDCMDSSSIPPVTGEAVVSISMRLLFCHFIYCIFIL